MLLNQNLDHQRARYAYECIKQISGVVGPKKEKDYHSAVLSSGLLIQNAGLMQVLSFYISKKENKHLNNSISNIRLDNMSHYELLSAHILNWILYKQDSNHNLLDMYCALLDKEDDEIISDTLEAKLFVNWLKRFSDSMLKSEDEDNGNE